MGLTTTVLTESKTSTDAVSFNTASITPGANALILAGLLVTVAASPTPTITLSGCGLTWVQVETSVPAARTALIFRAMGASPTTGALTITGDGTTLLTSAYWTVVQFDGADTSGTNGSGAIVQSLNAKPTATASVNVAFTATPGAGNGGLAVMGTTIAEAPTAGTGWTGTGATQAGPTSGYLGEYAATACPAAVTGSWTTSGNAFLAGAEVLAGASTFGPPTGLTATAVASTEVDLSWDPATGAAGYAVERDGVLIATGVAGTTYNDTGLSAVTTYAYNVRTEY